MANQEGYSCMTYIKHKGLYQVSHVDFLIMIRFSHWNKDFSNLECLESLVGLLLLLSRIVF